MPACWHRSERAGKRQEKAFLLGKASLWPAASLLLVGNVYSKTPHVYCTILAVGKEKELVPCQRVPELAFVPLGRPRCCIWALEVTGES